MKLAEYGTGHFEAIRAHQLLQTEISNSSLWFPCDDLDCEKHTDQADIVGHFWVVFEESEVDDEPEYIAQCTEQKYAVAIAKALEALPI